VPSRSRIQCCLRGDDFADPLPTQRQSAEGVRRVRQYLLKAGAKFKSDNAFSLELEGGSRVLALPGSDDSGIRGLSINGVLVLDEAARVSDELFNASLQWS